MSGTSTGRPVSNKLVVDIDMDCDTAATLEASVFMGKNYSDKLHSIKKNQGDTAIETAREHGLQLIMASNKTEAVVDFRGNGTAGA